jgi:L-malate glycosyltransferase
MRVLHLAAHLGGGVGKALSGLVAQAAASDARIEHAIVILEEPEKPQFIERIRRCGGEVMICPDADRLAASIAAADIVQLEWWNHPATIACLCNPPLPAMRLIVWCHVSGLHTPIIPRKLIAAAQRFLFTSPCSLKAVDPTSLPPNNAERLGVVSSCGGFDGLPWPDGQGGDRLVAGYIGSFNFSKMHPRYVEFLAAVEDADITVRLIGDATNRAELTRQCDEIGRPQLVEFRGYTRDVAAELASINVLAYLLNPQHYGTTENALLEAMAMGIVPIVLDNPAECCIIDDRRTGLIVASPAEFAAAVEWLSKNPDQRRRLGQQAAESVRVRFAVEKMELSLNAHYRAVASREKQPIAFTDIFGADPADWFLSCQEHPAVFLDADSSPRDVDELAAFGLLERTKGSVFHFSHYFPGNGRLAAWASRLAKLVNVLGAQA